MTVIKKPNKPIKMTPGQKLALECSEHAKLCAKLCKDGAMLADLYTALTTSATLLRKMARNVR